jgi:dihydroorotate dehydrogenase (fumarate)
MNLATTYMGFELPHPLVPGSSPLADNLDTVRRLEDAGAPLIILRSLFEEQLAHEDINVELAGDAPAAAYVETLSYLPEANDYVVQPDGYLELLRNRTRASAPDSSSRRAKLGIDE